MKDQHDWVSATTAQVLISFASRESATVDEVLSLARQLQPVFSEMSQRASTSHGPDAFDSVATRMIPAVPIEKSASDDTVTCLCCGKSFTMLKRHLKAEHGLTEALYREAFGLSEDHPLTAPSYSQRKADYAKQIGLGKYAREETMAGRSAAAT